MKKIKVAKDFKYAKDVFQFLTFIAPEMIILLVNCIWLRLTILLPTSTLLSTVTGYLSQGTY